MWRACLDWGADYVGRQGASVEQMAVEVNKKQSALDTAQRDLRVMVKLNKASFAFVPPARIADRALVTVSAKVYSDASQAVARIPSTHCASVQDILLLPPVEPWLLWQGFVRPCRGHAAAEGTNNKGACRESWTDTLLSVSGADGRPSRHPGRQSGEGSSLAQRR